MMVFNSLQREDISLSTFPGLYVGQVEDVEDEAELGRIQVSIPSIFDQTEPEFWVWARPCFPYGHFFVPEKGDKVWIAFENGDLIAPVWMGIWYPEGQVPEEAQESPPKKRAIRSSRGHLILLNDTKGEESITLQFKSDDSKGKITLDDSSLELRFGENTYIKLESDKMTLQADRIDLNP
jgi:hypothetical protein